jgi:predicted nucleic acid-binding protein
MKVVVADTSPLNYLVQIDEVNLLRVLYGTIVIPYEVFQELNHPGAPLAVSEWIRDSPPWLKIRPIASCPAIPGLMELDAGERAAIQLSQAEPEALLLIDDADGRRHAERLGLSNTGTLGVLRLAAVEGLIELRIVLDRLMQTNFRAASSLIRQLIAEDEARRRSSKD